MKVVAVFLAYLVSAWICHSIQYSQSIFLYVVKVAVGHPSEIDEIFDAISYSKGASVIRMLHDYIGDAVSLYCVYCLVSSV